jgi:hypothetical protein
VATLDSLIAQLRQAVDHIRQAVVQVRGARNMAKECQTRQHALGVPGVAVRFRAITDRAVELEHMLLAGIDAVERLIAQAEATRHGGKTAGGTAGVVPVASMPEPAGKPKAKVPATPGWRQRFAGEVPEHVREAGAEMRPRAPDDDRFTMGVLDGARIYSGGEDQHLANDLIWPRKAAPVTYWQHVESKVAARMRDEKRQHAEVTIDNTPCGAAPEEHDYVWGCDRILPGILPVGSTLVVWATCDGGRSFWRRAYHGTGERIRR